MVKNLILKNRVKEFRLREGMSQSELASSVGASRNTISNIECGVFNPSAYLSGLLCISLNCSWDDLFYFETSPLDTESY